MIEKITSILTMFPLAGFVLVYVAAGEKSMVQFLRETKRDWRKLSECCRKCKAPACKPTSLCRNHLADVLSN
jgi:hypothetical protein